MRIFEELPCGCLVSTDGGGGLSPCCYPQIGQIETELHKKCMRLYFEEHKTVQQIIHICKTVEGKVKVILYKETGEVEEIEAENLYHAQNILIYGFLLCDFSKRNDVVFGRIETKEKRDKIIFAFRTNEGITVRNATDNFLSSVT